MKKDTKNKIQKDFSKAINYDALRAAFADPKSKKEIMNILKKVRY